MSKSQAASTVDIPIKVINPSKKHESKTYMLSLQLDQVRTLECLREHILEQLGKDVIKFDLCFDVGYYSSSHKICFVHTKTELKRLYEKSKILWCDG